MASVYPAPVTIWYMCGASSVSQLGSTTKRSLISYLRILGQGYFRNAI